MVAILGLYCLMMGGVLMYTQECMKECMVLYPYKKWLLKLPKWIAKPLGLCVYCQAFWLHLVYYLLLPLPLPWLPLSLGGVFFSIEFIRWIKRE